MRLSPCRRPQGLLTAPATISPFCTPSVRPCFGSAAPHCCRVRLLCCSLEALCLAALDSQCLLSMSGSRLFAKLPSLQASPISAHHCAHHHPSADCHRGQRPHPARACCATAPAGWRLVCRQWPDRHVSPLIVQADLLARGAAYPSPCRHAPCAVQAGMPCSCVNAQLTYRLAAIHISWWLAGSPLWPRLPKHRSSLCQPQPHQALQSPWA